MHSLMKNYTVSTGEFNRDVIATAIRISNDLNGNPRAKVQIWTSVWNGSIWSPKVKGYRRSKDDTYVLKYVCNLEQDLDNFMLQFQESIQ